jgi:hypothetical protein
MSIPNGSGYAVDGVVNFGPPNGVRAINGWIRPDFSKFCYFTTDSVWASIQAYNSHDTTAFDFNIMSRDGIDYLRTKKGTLTKASVWSVYVKNASMKIGDSAFARNNWNTASNMVMTGDTCFSGGGTGKGGSVALGYHNKSYGDFQLVSGSYNTLGINATGSSILAGDHLTFDKANTANTMNLNATDTIIAGKAIMPDVSHTVDIGGHYIAGTSAYASYTGQVAGMTTPVTIVADNIGSGGNSILLAYNGTYKISQSIYAWNTIYPSNTCHLSTGDSLQIPDNKTTMWLSSGADLTNIIKSFKTIYIDTIKTTTIIQTQLSGSLTDGAPTNTEISGIVGKSATDVGNGFKVTIMDSDGTKLLYMIESYKGDWLYVVMAKAL